MIQSPMQEALPQSPSDFTLPITPRLYQQVIAAKASQKNTLVVLPTGLGKTVVSLMVALQRLKVHPTKKILIMAPTKPLASQHLESFKKLLANIVPEEQMVLFTGAVAPAKRAALFTTCQIIFSTPQGLENDVLASRIRLKDISLMVFDESHRATGEYSYVWLAKQYVKQADNPLILGLTASPGADRDTIQEVLDNLSIEQIEYRESTAPDVKPYLKETKLEYAEVTLPESFLDVHKMLQKSYIGKLNELKQHGFFQSKPATQIRKVELLQFVGSLQRRMAQEAFDPDVARGISLAAQALKISHAVELAETQGIPSLHAYMTGLLDDARKGKTKAVVAIAQDPNFKVAYAKTRQLILEECTHPKMKKLDDIVKKTLQNAKDPKDVKIIVFSQYRDTLETIKNQINKLKGLHAEMFVGQAKKKGLGMSQKKQLAMIQSFKDNEFNVICMSSVGEEGLDIPAVDLVVFYEPIPSAIRTIQRRGRTGRQEKGRVVVLMAKGTRDVAYRWVAARKEQNMYTALEEIADKINGTNKRDSKIQSSLDAFAQPIVTPKKTTSAPQPELKKEPRIEEEEEEVAIQQTPISQPEFPQTKGVEPIKIIADSREKSSKVLRTLHDFDLQLELKTLPLGDYHLSQDIVVEFKRVDDFVSSLIDGRLLKQVKSLKESVLKPLIVVEGEESIFAQRNIHPNSLYGLMSTITLSYGVPILFTRNEIDTANLLFMIARREQTEGKTHFSLHASHKPFDEKEQLEYVVGSIPNVGPAAAKKLLKHFGTIQNIATASEKAICEIEGIGPKTAKMICATLEKEYSKL